jgi:O-antigen/teichoic acid export membrane protein
MNYGMRRSLFLLNRMVRTQALFEITTTLVQIALALAMVPAFGVVGFIATVVGTAAVKNFLVHVWTQPLWRSAQASMAATLSDGLRRSIRHSSLHAVLRGLLSNCAGNADVLILSLSGRPEVVAVYRVAKSLASLPTKMAAPLWVVFRPRLLTALRADEHRRYCSLVIRVATLFALGSVAVILAAWLLGEPLLSHFYGPAYATALHPLVILIVASSVFGAVTGWLPFTMIISSRKTLGTMLFALQLALIAGAGLVLANGSAVGMAGVVAGSSVFVAVIAWWALLAGLFRHRGAGSSAM